MARTDEVFGTRSVPRRSAAAIAAHAIGKAARSPVVAENRTLIHRFEDDVLGFLGR
jgi:hypothetical protein